MIEKIAARKYINVILLNKIINKESLIHDWREYSNKSLQIDYATIMISKNKVNKLFGSCKPKFMIYEPDIICQY